MNFLTITISILTLLAIISYSRLESFYEIESEKSMYITSLHQSRKDHSARATKSFSTYKSRFSPTTQSDENVEPAPLSAFIQSLQSRDTDGFREAAILLMDHYYAKNGFVCNRPNCLSRFVDRIIEVAHKVGFKNNHSSKGGDLATLNLSAREHPDPDMQRVFYRLQKGHEEKYPPLKDWMGYSTEDGLYIRLTQNVIDVLDKTPQKSPPSVSL